MAALGNLAAGGPRGRKVSAADQAAIDEAQFFEDAEGSFLISRGQAPRPRSWRRTWPWRLPRPCRPTAGAPAAPSCPWKCEGEASGRPKGGWDALWEKIADHYRMTGLL